MPELPEIETVRRVVGPQMVGRRVTEVSVRHPKVIGRPDPESFAERLVGRTFTDLTRHGKSLTAILDDWSRMVMHMRMTGCLLAVPRGAAHPHHHRARRRDGTQVLRHPPLRTLLAAG